MPEIARGRTTAETALNVGCVSAQRKTWNEQSCIILMNIDENAAEVDLSAYADWSMVASVSANGEKISAKGATLKLPAYGLAVLRPNS
jgi:hypothetical protein